MQNELIQTISSVGVPNRGPVNEKDYAGILEAYGLKYRINGHYFQIGEITQTQGWILHISVVLSEFVDLLKALIPHLKTGNIPFKIVVSPDICSSMLDGSLGYTKLAKVICIYPSVDISIVSLTRQLILLTNNYNGPDILTDFHLGSQVYTRYGAFNPLIRRSPSGIEENFIYNSKGELVKDNYTIPFTFPQGISWPFTDFKSPVLPRQEKVLKDKYRPMSILKKDARGDIMKALYMKKRFVVKWCVLKQGRKYMKEDVNGRHIEDKLLWQKELHEQLHELPIPKLVDFFKENGDTYLAIEYIKGISLDLKVVSLLNGRIWERAPLKNRLLLLSYASQLLDIVEKMHEKGFVHRDINTLNFIVTKTNSLVVVDLELSYSIKLKKPFPPFTLGTPGFMSPEQIAIKQPTLKEDIYAVGATLLVIFTGLEPEKFESANYELLRKQLKIFIPDEKLTNIIARCLDHNPYPRSDLKSIKSAVQSFTAKTIQQPTIDANNWKGHLPGKEEIKQIINKAIKTLSTTLMVNPEGLWFSRTIQEEALSYYQMQELSFYGGFNIGIGGVLYTLALAKSSGFSIADCNVHYTNGLKFIEKRYLSNVSAVSPGLYAGTAGTAVALAEGSKNGLINPEWAAVKMKLCLENLIQNDFSIADGIAGQGLALLKCEPFLGASFVNGRLDKIIDVLLHSQQKDGSWLHFPLEIKKGDLKITGYSHGVAGIACFLLSYASQKQNPIAREAALKGISWITKQSFKKRGRILWAINNKRKGIEFGMDNGISGIALAYIKAHEACQDPVYRKMSEAALQNYDPLICWRDLSLANGVVGIGEVYLEAVKTFTSGEWQDRVDWITRLLLHSYRQQEDTSVYWRLDTNAVSTADLTVGNSGAIHFLLRYLLPGKFNHPLLII